MSAHDGDFSELLTDLSLVGLRNQQPRLLLNVRPRGGKPIQPAKPTKYDCLIQILSKALDERLARKLTRKQYREIRIRANNAIRRLPR
jgi:hypothetical protein